MSPTVKIEAAFDPENIKRFSFSSGFGSYEHHEGQIVRFSDYLKLLEMYRAKCAEVKA